MRTTRRPSTTGPERHRPLLDRPVLVARPARSACRGRCRSRCRAPARRRTDVPGTRSRTKRPGVSACAGWRRPRGRGSCRCRRSTWLSRKFSWPSCGNSGSAAERHLDRQAGLRALRALAGGGERAVAQEALLVDVEDGVDRIERHDGRHQRRFAGTARHEIALGGDGAADAPGDRRGDAGELEIQLGGAQRRGDRVDLRRRLGGERGAAVVLLPRHRVLRGQALGALRFGVGALHRRPGARELRLQAIDFGLERPRSRSGRGDRRAGTIAPSRKRTPATKPDTRGRTATVLTASSRPVNSSHSVTSRSTTWRRETFGGGGSAGCAAGRAQPAELSPTQSDQEEQDHGDDERADRVHAACRSSAGLAGVWSCMAR